MEVIVRSQNGFALLKTCNNFYINLNSIFSYDNDGTRILLGVYSTGEKAIKVLDELQEFMENDCNGGLAFMFPRDDEVK